MFGDHFTSTHVLSAISYIIYSGLSTFISLHKNLLKYNYTNILLYAY